MRLFRHLLSVLLLCAAGPIALRARPISPTPPADGADTAAWDLHFAEREAAAPTDAQLWIDRFNYLFNRARRSVIVLRGTDGGARLPGEGDEALLLQDSTGCTAGLLCERTAYDETLLMRSLAAIDRGIALHPDRLDMRLGRAAACRHAERWRQMAETLCALLDRAERNGGAWCAPDGTALPVPPQELVAEWLQGYVGALFDAASPESRDEAFEALERLVVRETAFCPASAVACNNRAVLCHVAGDTAGALEWLLHASEADPHDAMIRYNIGCLYAAQGDRMQARRWWTALLDSSDGYYRAAAAEALEELDGTPAPELSKESE